MTTLQDIVGGGPLGRLFDANDPNSQMALMQVGLQMMNQQPVGTTFGQNILNSAAGGLNYLSQLEAARNQAALQQQDADTRSLDAATRANVGEAQVNVWDRELDQRDVSNAINLLATEQDGFIRSKVAFRLAELKAKEEADEWKKSVMEKLLDIQKEKISQGISTSADAEELLSQFRMISEPGKFQVDAIVRGTHPETGEEGYILRVPAFQQGIDPETTEKRRPYEFIPLAGRASIRAYGFDPDVIDKVYQENVDRQAARPVHEDLPKARPNAQGQFEIGEPAPQRSEETPSSSTSESARPAGDSELTPQQQLAQSQAQQTLAESRARREAEKRANEFIIARRKELQMRGSQNNSANQALVLGDYEKNFHKLDTWQQEAWLSFFGKYLSAEKRAEAQQRMGGAVE